MTADLIANLVEIAILLIGGGIIFYQLNLTAQATLALAQALRAQADTLNLLSEQVAELRNRIDGGSNARRA